MTSRRTFVHHGAVLAAGAALRPLLAGARPAPVYVCPPCGCAMDGRFFDAPGRCPACDMTLIEAMPAQLPFEPSTLALGRGAFLMAGGAGRQEKRITVAYYKPSRFTVASPILIVLPGSGRNAVDYREPWIPRAEQANVLVAALGYPEADYDFAAYQLGGVVSDLTLRNLPPLVNGCLLYTSDAADE